MLQDRRIKLAGHILRSDNRDPLRKVSYQPDSAETFNVGKRRVGGPRQLSTTYTSKCAWENRLNKGNFENTTRQTTEILQFARSRQFWASPPHARGFTHMPNRHETMAVKRRGEHQILARDGTSSCVYTVFQLYLDVCRCALLTEASPWKLSLYALRCHRANSSLW